MTVIPYLTVNFSSPNYGGQNPHSRTLGPEDKETTDGKSITKAHIYLLGADGKVAHSIATDVKDGKTIEPVRVEVGKYRVFVVTNPGTLVPRKLVPPKAKGADIQKIIEGVTYENAKDGFEDGEFLMTTAVNTEDLLGAASPVEVTKSHSKNNPVVVNAKVDRMAVKIENVPVTNLKLSGEFGTVTDKNRFKLSDVTKYEIKIKDFALVNGNQSINLFQTWKKSTDEPEGRYMETPQGKLEAVEGGEKMTGYYRPFSEFTEVTMKNGEVDLKKNISVDGMFTDKPVFTVENRPEFVKNTKLTAGKAQTTGVIYRAEIKAKGADENKDYYYYDGKIYTDTVDLKALEAFKHQDFTKLEPEAIRKLGVKVYERGVMYYTYFIIDQNYKVEYKNAETLYYAVHRNSVYKLEVEELARLGDDVPGGGDITPVNPNPEIDPDAFYLKMNVEVNPWVLNSNKITFD